jgi:tetratricopeptide (TPR) repeat protein
MIGAGAGEPRSWWELLLDTGRPGGGDRHKMGVREWWERFRDRLGWGQDDRLARGERLRPTIEQRWAELLRRYGRWGPMTLTDLDLKVVSGYGLTALGDYERAIKVLKEAVRSTSDPERLGELYQTLATAYYFQGYRLQQDRLATYDLRLVKLSAEAYEQALRYRPQVISYGNLGWTYYLLGEYRLSEQYSLRALSYDDSLDYVRLNLGLLYLVQGRFRESFQTYRQVAVRFPTDDVLLGGISDLKEVLRDRARRHPFAHIMVGYLNLQRGDLPDARRHLRAYLNHPGAEPAWRSLAQRWLNDPASALEG